MERPDTDRQRVETLRQLKIGCIVLVAASAGLIGLFVDASAVEILAAIGGGAVAGAVLAWLVFPSADGVRSDRSRRRR